MRESRLRVLICCVLLLQDQTRTGCTTRHFLDMYDSPTFVRLNLQQSSTTLTLQAPPQSSSTTTTTIRHNHRRFPIQTTVKFSVLTTSITGTAAMDTTMTMDTSTASSNRLNHPARKNNDKAPLAISTTSTNSSTGCNSLFPSMTASNFLISPSSSSSSLSPTTMMLSYDVFSLFQLGAAGASSRKAQQTAAAAVWNETTTRRSNNDDDELEDLVRIQQHPQQLVTNTNNNESSTTVTSTNGDDVKDDIQQRAKSKMMMVSTAIPTTESSCSNEGHIVPQPPHHSTRSSVAATTTLRDTNNVNVSPSVVDDIVVSNNPNHVVAFDESLLHSLDQYQAMSWWRRHSNV